MANKLIEELIIKVKQQGAKPTEKAITGVGEAFDTAKKNVNAFNSASERVPKYLKKIEESADRAAKSMGKVKFTMDSTTIEASLGRIEGSLEALIGESHDLYDAMAKMNNNLITLFQNMSTELGADLERVEDGLIDVRKESGKTNEALGKVGKGAKKAGRGLANSNRQGRNQARTFADLAKFAGPLPLLYANIAANVFALSEAFRILTEGEQLNRLEEVGKIVGSQIGAPVQFTASKMQELTGQTLSYGEALRNAAAAASYGFDSEQIEQLTMAARRASIALGVDMQDAMNRVIRGTSKLEIELLDELGITTKLTTAYQNYAQKLGVSAQSLNSYQQRAALVNEINAQSIEKFGDLDEMLRDGAPWERFGANAGTAFQTFSKNLASATDGMATFFNDWLFGEKTLSEANTKAQLLGETLSRAFREDTRSGMVGGLVQLRDLTTQYKGELDEVLASMANPKPGQSIDDLSTKAGFLRSAITRLKIASQEYSLESVKDLDKADAAYRNLSATVKGSVQSYETSLATIKGQSAAYEKLYSDVENMQKAYYQLKEADPAFDAAEALTKLGFKSEAAMNSAVKLARTYRDTNRELAVFAKTQAEAEVQGRYSGKEPEAVKLGLLKEQQLLYTKLLVDQQRLGASSVATAKTSAEIAKIVSQTIDTQVALVDVHTKELDTQTRLNMALQPELLIKKDLLSNEKTRLANLQLIQGTHKEQEQSLNRIKQLENEILAAQVAQSNAMMDSALGNLASFAPGIDQMTSSINGLAMSFNNMGQSSMTATQMVSSGLNAFQGLLSYSSNQAIQAVDAQIAAEQKRDGKSKESVAKINALEKKKIEQQKKAAKQQILISTAVAVMNAAANPWPVPAIPLMATAALAGGLAYQQASSASSNLVSSASGNTQASLTLGDRSNQVDVSQSASRGELAYIRNESGTGSMQSFTPRANGGIGIPGNSLVVGEHGPEVITPLEPIQAYSAEESRAMGGGYTDNRQLVVQAIDTQSIMDRADDIFNAWDDAAYQRGMNSDRLR
ncbi:tail length tape measure protein [Vibrio phage Thalassa]|uniref:Pore-forming tail tip protein n=1 Tax=Vibrio phage Thalassa TaxID=2570301 RepID=A0A2H5BGX9_9CAUD|nr:tail length tape measure protein [Vibrio phage Thalassa]AUG85234.1 pore-forming tail tip protein [Vibrio phage Thalassa]